MYFSKKNIYAYGFATPAGASISSNPESSEYNNIFSVIDYNDPVPLVAPQQWKFSRYGTTKILPYRESNNEKTYSEYIDRIKYKLGSDYKVGSFVNYNYNYVVSGIYREQRVPLGDLTGITCSIANPFNHDTLGTYNRKLIAAIVSSLGDRNSYSTEFQSKVMRTLYKQQKKNLHFGNLLWIFASDIVPDTLQSHPNISSTLYWNYDKLVSVHANARYYVYWMQMMDENYPGHLPLKWGSKNYRIFRSDCPVDLHVYNSNNEEVGSIINGIPQNVSEDSSVITSIDENDRKIVYLPVDGEYSVQVKALEDCEVSCGVEEYCAEYGEKTRITNFNTVTMTKSETMTASVASFSDEEIEEGVLDGSDADYSLNKGGENVAVYSDLKGYDDIANHSYSINASYDEEKGDVFGCGTYSEGSFVVITASNKPGFDFDGFYIDGVKQEEYTDYNNTRIQVNNDIKLVAKYKECKHKFDDSKWKITQKATKDKPGYRKNTCEICGFEKVEKYSLEDEKKDDNSKNKNKDGYVDAGKGIGKISSDGKYLIDTNGKKFYMADKITDDDILCYVNVADKKTNGKYKITKLKTKKEEGIFGDYYIPISGNVTYVGLYNSNSKAVKIPDSIIINGVTFKVTSISNNAIKKNNNIKKVTIGKNVTQIGKNAFNGCKNLKKIIIKTTNLKKIGSSAFKGIHSKAKFKVPKKNLKKYKKMIKKAGAPKKSKITK